MSEEKIWKSGVMAYLRFYLEIWLEELRKMTKELS
jgi:hypothetical protein